LNIILIDFWRVCEKPKEFLLFPSHFHIDKIKNNSQSVFSLSHNLS